ncbi:hypothetical protein [Saccharicrinis aurantiacus]|uniref:hypothetical protein n=1 Tax=Saccharicrinis aurantiacus TaxID=1849719 RepID=UPI000839786C|nr:hypothetical protein [Saccharicrinis aurantiacus]
MKIYLYITTLFIAISVMSCASTKNKAYKELCKHYINTAELDTIMGMDQFPMQYLEFEKTFPKPYQMLKDYLNDSTAESRQVFYEDDKVRKTTRISGVDSFSGLHGINIYIYIIKKII